MTRLISQSTSETAIPRPVENGYRRYRSWPDKFSAACGHSEGTALPTDFCIDKKIKNWNKGPLLRQGRNKKEKKRVWGK